MADDLELVTVESTSNSAIAQVVAGILAEAGIPAYVDGALLQDEWGMARKLTATRVQVPRDRLEEARRVLREAREEGARHAEGAEEPAGTLDSDPPAGLPPLPLVAPGEEPSPPGAGADGDVIVWPPGLLPELLVVFLVALVPNLFYSFAGLVLPPEQSLPFAYVNLSGLVQGVVPAALVLYLIHRSDEPRGDFGLVRPRPWDIALALVVWGVEFLLFGLAIAPALEFFAAPATFEALEARLRIWFPAPEAPWQYALLAAECCAIGFGEEILFRGYLIPRVSRLLRSEGAALLVTSLIFGLCHAYQGVLGVASSAWWGLVSGAFFLVVPRIWPLALAHAAHNFLWSVG